jgi:hypothetical protein
VPLLPPQRPRTDLPVRDYRTIPCATWWVLRAGAASGGAVTLRAA